MNLNQFGIAVGTACLVIVPAGIVSLFGDKTEAPAPPAPTPTPVATPTLEPEFPPMCEQEDGPGPCFWDTRRGNGIGDSVWLDEFGDAYPVVDWSWVDADFATDLDDMSEDGPYPAGSPGRYWTECVFLAGQPVDGLRTSFVVCPDGYSEKFYS